ncbi:MAG: DUF2007 domain-containing protein [Bacteroidales bacterium]|nr:DUF2007 domain-containing protein [Bacteroidales bacterium]
MKTVNLITCDNVIDAHLIKGRLNSEGIECFLTNENFTNLFPMYNNMLGSGIQIIINENDLQIARELLKDKIQPDNTHLVCPHCGSTQIVLGFGRFKWLKIFNIFLVVLAMFPIGNLKPKYYCKNCKSEIK